MFQKFIFKLFPRAVRESDSYKLPDGRGLLERYVSIFEKELDEEVVPFVKDFTNLIDTSLSNPKYLPYLSYTLGSPVNIGGSNIDAYRRLLAYTMQIWKTKGSKECYELVFRIVGLNISIIEIPAKKAITYDLDNTYYDDNFIYDQDCEMCSDYYIAYNSINNTTSPWSTESVPNDLLLRMESMLPMIQPINAKFKGFIKQLHIVESVDLVITESRT